MPFYEKGSVRIHYEEAGSGFPLLIIAGGGLNSTVSYFTGNAPFNPMLEFKSEYRCIAADLRNANGGQSSGPLEIERPWDAYADDQLGLRGNGPVEAAGQVVENDYPLAASDQLPHHVAADEAAASGDQYTHAAQPRIRDLWTDR